MDISAVPVGYDGVMFRSTLEADWVATLDGPRADVADDPGRAPRTVAAGRPKVP